MKSRDRSNRAEVPPGRTFIFVHVETHTTVVVMARDHLTAIRALAQHLHLKNPLYWSGDHRDYRQDILNGGWLSMVDPDYVSTEEVSHV